MLRGSSQRVLETRDDDVELRERDASALLPPPADNHDNAASAHNPEALLTSSWNDVSTPSPFESFKMPDGEELTHEELL
jgi:hypothetical protein